jgi:hypothetical protein
LWKDTSVHRKSTVENVILSAPLRFYGDENDQVTEETTLNPDSEGGRQLEIVETLYKIIPFSKRRFYVWRINWRRPKSSSFPSRKENLDNLTHQ